VVARVFISFRCPHLLAVDSYLNLRLSWTVYLRDLILAAFSLAIKALYFDFPFYKVQT
jgi:hypothetical protein